MNWCEIAEIQFEKKVGMMHAPNHWNDNLGNLSERISQGSMPR
jgi:hypothetical protein